MGIQAVSCGGHDSLLFLQDIEC